MTKSEQAFYDVVKTMSQTQSSYLSNFNFSACELWLCNEICNMLNFGEFDSVKQCNNEFIYNEDCKRDLSIYSGSEDSELRLLEHIEVKVVYPSQKIEHKNNWLDSVINKLKKSVTNTPNVGLSGWVFFVWTSCDEYIRLCPEPESFYGRDIQKISARLSEDFISSSEFKCINILDGFIHWRGKDKRIVVKGMEFRMRGSGHKIA